MPAATPIPKLAALLVMVTAVALVSHEVAAVSANATEAHKSISASAMFVSRDTDADPKYDMHSLRTGDTTRAETAEERGSSLENFRNTVSSWAKGVKMKSRPKSHHGASITSAKDGLRSSSSIIKSGETDETVFSRFKTQDNSFPILIAVKSSPKLTEWQLQYLKSLCDKEPFFDIAMQDIHIPALTTVEETATKHLWDMYIARDNAITVCLSGWKKDGKKSVTELVKPAFTTSDEVAKLYQLKYDSYCHNMEKVKGGRLDDSMDADERANWLFYNQPFLDLARRLFSPGLSEAALNKVTQNLYSMYYERDKGFLDHFAKWNARGILDISDQLNSFGYTENFVMRLYQLKYESYRKMTVKLELNSGAN